MHILPEARNTELVVSQLGKELLIYDLKANRAYTLNQTAMIVFNACDGKQTFDDLKRKHKFTDDLIYLTLDALKEKGLLAEGYISPFAGMNRREVIRKVGLASMIALPLVSGIVAPSAVDAASDACVPLNTCQSSQLYFCPPGCAGVHTFTFYSTTNGTCGGTTILGSADCVLNQGNRTANDFKRTS